MEKKHAAPPVSEINVTPMVDVMLVVLIIFMVITPLLSKSIPLEMARARNPITMPDADKEDAVIIAVSRDGQTFLSPGVKRTNVEDLAPQVKELLAGRPNKTVYIKADARAKYGKVEEVVDNLRSGGVSELGLLADQDLLAASTKKKPGQP
jgi:biopolymer transport protein ExbD